MDDEKKTGDLKGLNKELVLREYLAIERTKMANHRTLLAYVRTGLYFIVAGSTLEQVTDVVLWKYLGTPFIFIGVILMSVGAFLYRKSRRSLIESHKQVGKATNEYIRSVRAIEDIE